MTNTNANSAVPEIVYLKPRVTMVPLEWPVKVDGVEYREIGLKRMSVKEVSEFVEAISGDNGRFPIFVDVAGEPVSEVVLNVLADDDMLMLTEKMRDFLPRRFRVGTPAANQTSDQSSQSVSPSSPGAPTAPMSATS